MNTLQDFLDRQAPLSPGARTDTGAIALRMKSALLKSLLGTPGVDLPNIKVEADKLTPPERDALKIAFNDFVDFHQALIVDGVIP